MRQAHEKGWVELDVKNEINMTFKYSLLIICTTNFFGWNNVSSIRLSLNILLKCVLIHTMGQLAHFFTECQNWKF